MPLTHRSKNQLENVTERFEEYKQQMKDDFAVTVDEVLENEIEQYCARRPRQGYGFSFASYIRGLYYLTFARFTNPLAYRMAWEVLRKMQERENNEGECPCVVDDGGSNDINENH